MEDVYSNFAIDHKKVAKYQNSIHADNAFHRKNCVVHKKIVHSQKFGQRQKLGLSQKICIAGTMNGPVFLT